MVLNIKKLSIFLIPILMVLGCDQSQPTKPMDEIKLQLKWYHQAQFSGYYLAQERGYYAKENIKIVFEEGGEKVDIKKRLVSGEVDFAVLSPEFVLIGCSEGDPIKAISAIYRRSATLFVALADSGIKRPPDFIGKTIAALGSGGAMDFEIQFLAMMSKLHLDISKMKLVSYDPSYKDFYKGDVQVTPTYYTGGLIKMRQKQIAVNLIWPNEYGIHFYSDILVATDKMIQEKPELVLRFLRASLKGWEDAAADYHVAAEVTSKYTKTQDIELQKAMAEAMLPLIHTGEGRIGSMKPEVWAQMTAIMEEQGLLATTVDPFSVYTMKFLDELAGAQNP